MALVSWSRASAACQQSRAKLLPTENVLAPAGIIAVTPASPATAAVKRAFMETSSQLLRDQLYAFRTAVSRPFRPSDEPFSRRRRRAICGVSAHGGAGRSSGQAPPPSPFG